MHSRMSPHRGHHGDVWSIVLAGGEGVRLRDVTDPDGDSSIPKQYRHFHPGRTLFQSALLRCMQITTAHRIVAIVAHQHRHWWHQDLMEIPRGNRLAQPANRGTAAGVLLGLLHVLFQDGDPVVVVFPSDHDVQDEGALLASLREAVRSTREWPDHIILLGMPPEKADPEYGWVLPVAGRAGATRGVRLLVEKPPPEKATRLMRKGAFWNSFIFASKGQTLLKLYQEMQPELLNRFLTSLIDLDPGSGSLDALYRELPVRDFGLNLLMRDCGRLRLLPVPACGWNDLGTPARVREWKLRQGNLAIG